MRRAAAPRAAASARDARRRSSASSRNAPSATAGSRVRARLTCSANAVVVARQRIVADERAVGDGARARRPAARRCGIVVSQLQRRLRRIRARPFRSGAQRILQCDARSGARRRARVAASRRAARVEQRERDAVAVVDQRRIAGDALRRRCAIVSDSGRSPKSHVREPACARTRARRPRTTAARPRPSCARSAARSRPLAELLAGGVDDAHVDAQMRRAARSPSQHRGRRALAAARCAR